MSKMIKYLWPFWMQILLVFALVFARVMLDLQLPNLMAKIVDIGIKNSDLPYIYQTGALMMGVTFLSIIGAVASSFLAARIGAKFSYQMRNRVFEKVESFSLTELNQFSTASLITRTTNDIQQIQNILVVLLRMIVLAPVMAIGAIIFAINTHAPLTWIIAIAIGALLLLVFGVFGTILPRYKIIQKLIDKMNLVTRENLTGLRVIRAFNTQHHEEEKFDGVNKDTVKMNLFVNRVANLMNPGMTIIMNGTVLMIALIGARQIASGSLEVGNMMAFMQYTMQVVFAFMMMTMIFIMIPRASVSAHRVREVLDMPLSIFDPKDPITPKDILGEVRFESVSFQYPNADLPVVSDITFTAKPGQMTAIIGSTGSGKSTVINLIPRFFDATKGEVLLDNVNVKDMRQEDLRELIGYVPQKGTLFSGTISSNLRFGKNDATDEQVQKAVKMAQAYDFIASFDQQYDTRIAQGGTNVSGGQRQRLSIARAIVKDPKIYIFDDSFSALDFKTDFALRQALMNNIKATVIVVAQRINTILKADQIVVLDQGRVVGIGDHKTLIKTCAVYQEIAQSQLTKEELDHVGTE